MGLLTLYPPSSAQDNGLKQEMSQTNCDKTVCILKTIAGDWSMSKLNADTLDNEQHILGYLTPFCWLHNSSFTVL